MSAAQYLLWVALPYITILSFVGGTIYRYRREKLEVRAPSSQLLTKSVVRWAAPLWHYGMILVVLGHIAGLLVPPSALASLGLTPQAHIEVAVALGLPAGAAMFIGLLSLAIRDIANARLSKVPTWDYALFYALALTVAALGLATTASQLIRPYDYDATVGAWIRGVLSLRPDPAAMASAPALFQIHAAFAMVFLTVMPYTFAVHYITGLRDILLYPFRPRIIYRRL
ncbi:MAG: respiratory nitrate reductase subunit gamma [Thermoproteus sp. AZ2]|jgi:nitrate reductase gamma subunit|uniref:Respiratory nitrate reductase subunit gamma n=1 Tax=Thermoproteus sp. AZ2 TaxID=1609232 RepID=A0ACC6V228_9CREN